MATKAPAKKVRVTAKHKAEHRNKPARDPSPSWEGCETWTSEQFMQNFRKAMDYYRLETDGKFVKPAVLKWMENQGCAKSDIMAFRKVKDSRCGVTMGSLAACLNKGMLAQREDWNGGRDSAAWLRTEIAKVIDEGKYDIDPEEAKVEKVNTPTVSIQDRMRETAGRMVEEIEDAIESFAEDRKSFDPKSFKILNLLKGKQVKAAHARVIRGFYQRTLAEQEEALEGKDPQLKEAYSHMTKSELKKIIAFYQEVISACDMLAQEAKVNRKPRAKKPTDKAKQTAKLKYLKTHEPLKLVSVNPVDIIGSRELWVYNTKTRKLGRYVTSDFNELGIKGTTITGFDDKNSVQKTLRKPEEKLKEFKAAGKVALRKFLDEINSVDVKLNGRINEDTVLLKVS